MLHTRFRSLRQLGFLLLLTSFGYLHGDLLAQQRTNDDLLRKQEALNKVIRDKLESQIKDTFDDAQRLSRTSKVRAVERLKVLQNNIEGEVSLNPEKKKEYLNQVAMRIKSIETGKSVEEETLSPEKRAILAAERAKAKAIQEEREDVRRSLDTIASLTKSGDTAQARKEADALLKKYPTNPAALVLSEQTSWTDRITEARILVAQQQEGFLLAMRSVDKAAIPIKDDLEYDTIKKGYFKEIYARRTKDNTTEREKAILKSLSTQITISTKERPFEEVISEISTLIKQPILLDKVSLNDAEIKSSTTISVDLKNVTARTALRKILQDQGLTFIIKEETIQVVTLAKARENMVTKVYYLGDILSGNGPFANQYLLGPQINAQLMSEMADQIVRQIEKSVDPLSWKHEGGNGSIQFHLPSLSLIIRQTSEVHSVLQKSLGGSR